MSERDDKIERLARAIAAGHAGAIVSGASDGRGNQFRDVAYWAGCGAFPESSHPRFVNDHWREYRLSAELVLGAIREPTVEMEVAGTEQWMCEAAMEDRSKANWQAMIDEILR